MAGSIISKVKRKAVNMEKFEILQRKLVPLWQMIGSKLDGVDEEGNTVVVVPSLTVDIDFPSSAQQAYEERLLFMLFLFLNPIVYIFQPHDVRRCASFLF